MRLIVRSQHEFILNKLIETIRSIKEKSETLIDYNGSIEFMITEIISDKMRKIASENEKINNSGELLARAIEFVNEILLKEFNKNNISFEIEDYFSMIRQKLDFPAREVFDLRENLARSKEINRVGEKTLSHTNFNVPFEIIELGLRDSIDGLLVNPLIKSYEIDIDKIKEKYETNGDWFPYEVNIEDSVYVIDDDGTIFTSTENYPKRIILQMKYIMEKLANELYIPITNE